MLVNQLLALMLWKEDYSSAILPAVVAGDSATGDISLRGRLNLNN
jgi:hypothetical protein